MNDAEIYRKLSGAVNAYVEAGEARLKALKECFPRGSYVRWKVGPYIKSGIVTGHHPAFFELFVREGDARPCRVTAYSILGLLEKEHC